MKTRNKAFSMVELMIVIVIVAILAAVATPMLRNRLEKAKWSEAMAGCSAIATSLRAWAAENSENSAASEPENPEDLGFSVHDLDGKYFDRDDYEITSCEYDASTGELLFTITVDGDGENGAPEGTLTLTKAEGENTIFELEDSSGNTTTF